MAWAFTDNFNSYSAGNLTTQGGWSGSTNFQVETTQVFEGANGVECSSAALSSITRGSISETGGTYYFAEMMHTMGNNGNEAWLYMRDASNNSSNAGCGIRNISSVATLGYHDGNGEAFTSLTSGSLDVWYIFGIEFNLLSDLKSRFKWKQSGGTWSAYSAYASPTTAFATPITQAIMYVENGTWDVFYDTIANTDPAPDTTATVIKRRFLTLLGVGK